METKEKVLSELYALRAGLSAISVEYDKVREIDKTAAEGFSAVVTQMQTVGREQENVMRQKFRYSEPIYHYEYSMPSGLWEQSSDSYQNSINCGKWYASDKSREYYEEMYNAAVEEKETGNDFNRKRKGLLGGFFWGLLLLAVAAVVLGIALGINRTISIWGTLGLIAAGILIFLAGMYFAIWRKEYSVSYKREKQRATERLAIATGLYNAYPAANEKAILILNERSNKIAPLKEACAEFYRALQKQFSNILDDRDWKNLDLVIFELETRRADTLKEALQLVDRELQTERIEKTLIMATEQICSEIRRGFAELKSTIVECSRQILGQLAVVNFQLAEVSNQLSGLTDAVNLGNALQAKANETSAQIMNDVNAIRFYGV